MSNKILQANFEQAKTYIDQGDVKSLKQHIDKYPELCDSIYGEDKPPSHENSLLLYLTSWPGGRTNGADSARILLESGADPGLRFHE